MSVSPLLKPTSFVFSFSSYTSRPRLCVYAQLSHCPGCIPFLTLEMPGHLTPRSSPQGPTRECFRTLRTPPLLPQSEILCFIVALFCFCQPYLLLPMCAYLITNPTGLLYVRPLALLFVLSPVHWLLYPREVFTILESHMFACTSAPASPLSSPSWAIFPFLINF